MWAVNKLVSEINLATADIFLCMCYYLQLICLVLLFPNDMN